jgi:hypothetical protein
MQIAKYQQVLGFARQGFGMVITAMSHSVFETFRKRFD